MKIQHWAIIFIIIMLPLSIVCRNVINKKNLVLRDETRYNNIVDNATYDAVSQILEVAEELGYGKNIPITEKVALSAIDRFFSTLSVNFNLPIGENAKYYFSSYIPAIIIVGYDGLYVYSCEETSSGYDFKLKPKIPYSYANGDVLINFTLDNYITAYFPAKDYLVSGYVGDTEIDQSLKDAIDGVVPDKDLHLYTDNLSYILEKMSLVDPFFEKVDFLYSGDTSQDYEYTDNMEIAQVAGRFHKLRRETIINLIKSVMRQEFNEHNEYTKTLGITYEFNIPDIGVDQWNNTIDDISVLAFFQGMPMGAEVYYNNFSLGGARIVKAKYLYGETVKDNGVEHKVYHKSYCPLIPKSGDEIRYSSGGTFKYGEFPNGNERETTGVEQIFINAEHAKKAGYYICSECM